MEYTRENKEKKNIRGQVLCSPPNTSNTIPNHPTRPNFGQQWKFEPPTFPTPYHLPNTPTPPNNTPSLRLDLPNQTTHTLELVTASLLSNQTLEETWYCGMRPNQSASRIYCPRTYRELSFDPACWNKFFSMACNTSEHQLPEHKDVDLIVTVSEVWRNLM